MNQTDALLIFPKLGTWDDIIRDIPLGVIYAATASIKRGFNVKVLDLRFHEDDWRTELDAVLGKGCSLVGVSVMTGNPVRSALDVSRYIKEKYPNVPTVWGGPHPTTLPEQTLEHPDVDYVVCDGGSEPLAGLLDHLTGGPTKLEEILGLGFKQDGQIRVNPPQTEFEILNFRDIPYHLVDITGKHYNRLNSGELVFPIFMSAGCPYQCTFCVSPAMYKKVKGKKWVSYGVNEVLDHIQYLADRYDFPRIQVYDDESFINPREMREILEGFIARGFSKRFKLDFRGIRFGDIDRMDDDYLQLMSDAGVEYMFCGLESGSPRMLKIMKKAITVEQALRVNRRLAKFPKLKPHYNFFCGMPGETYESIVETKGVILQLVDEHPTAYLGHGGHWKPIPGSAATDIAVAKYGLKLPDSLEGWAYIDTLDLDAKPPDYSWYNPQMNKMIRLLTLGGMLLDGKTKDLIGNIRMSGVAHALIRMYRPLLRLRMKYNFADYLVEMKIYNYAMNRLGSMLKSRFKKEQRPKNPDNEKTWRQPQDKTATASV